MPWKTHSSKNGSSSNSYKLTSISPDIRRKVFGFIAACAYIPISFTNISHICYSHYKSFSFHSFGSAL